MYRLQLTNLIDLKNSANLKKGRLNFSSRLFVVTLEEIASSELTGITNHFANILSGNLFMNFDSFEGYSYFDKELSEVLKKNYEVGKDNKILVLAPTEEVHCHDIFLNGEGIEDILKSLTLKYAIKTNIGIDVDFIMLYIPALKTNTNEYKTRFSSKKFYKFYELSAGNGILIAQAK